MSDTYKTRPFRVQMGDPGRAYAVHNHALGECSLPTSPTEGWSSASCYWSWVWWKLSCGCRQCTNYYGRRQDRRADRRKARKALREGRFDDL